MAESNHDYTSDLTVFVSTVGYPTYAQCMERLRDQDCAFVLEVIDDVAPMSAAFQRMLERCRTPYFVQVDEDMLLHPHAIRTLYELISNSGPDVAQYVCALYDVHLESVIYGIKIYRHAIVRNYAFRDVDGCEWDQIRRLRADGYVDIRVPLEGMISNDPLVLGLHGTFWTTRAVYIRFAMLERRRRKGNRTHEWVPAAARHLLDRFLRERSEIDFYALMGVFAGALTEHLRTGQERDYRSYTEEPGYRQAQEFAQRAREGWREGEVVDPDVDGIDVLRR